MCHQVQAGQLLGQELTEDDVSALLWPCGSGHLDLAYHFQDAAPYPQGEVDSWGAREEDELSDYLLLQDLIENIPQAVFGGILIKVGADTFDWAPLRCAHGGLLTTLLAGLCRSR